MSKNDRASLNATLKTATDSLVPLVTEANEEDTRHALAYGRIFVRIALQVSAGAIAATELGKDWRAWASKSLSDLSKSVSPPTLYRIRNAGAVASILADTVGEAPYTSLVPLYRLLADVKGDTAESLKTAIDAAHETIRQTWASVCEASAPMSPTEEQVRTAVEAIAPTTRGSKGKTAKGRAAAKTAKNARTRQTPNTPTETTENGGQGNVETVKIDPAAVEAAGKIVATMAANLVKTQKIEASAVRACMLATVRLCREHGADTIAATLLTPADAGK